MHDGIEELAWCQAGHLKNRPTVACFGDTCALPPWFPLVWRNSQAAVSYCSCRTLAHTLTQLSPPDPRASCVLGLPPTNHPPAHHTLFIRLCCAVRPRTCLTSVRAAARVARVRPMARSAFIPLGQMRATGSSCFIFLSARRKVCGVIMLVEPAMISRPKARSTSCTERSSE